MKTATLNPPIFSNRKWYSNWLASEVQNGEKNFSNFRKKSKYLLPISWTRGKQYKEMLDIVFGSECYVCGFKGRLELAHMFYAEDSIKGKATGARTMARLREALTKPERFRRLCSICHDIFDHARRNGNVDYLNKINSLINSAKIYEQANT